jgi:transposase
MLTIGSLARIFLCQNPTDLRKGFEGLSLLVDTLFSGELFTGAYFVFLNRRRDRMKVLYWDADGLAIWYKRLEKGTFSKRNMNKILMGRREFFMLLEGIIPRRMQKRYTLS